MKKELNIQHSTLKTENSAFNTQNSKLPKGWVWVKLGEIAEIISGVSFKPEQLCKQDVENVRILRGGNIQNDDYFLLEDDYFVPKDIVSDDQLLRRYDIILVSSTGSKQTIGKAAIIKEELNNLSVGAFLRIIRIYENIQKKYIGFYFYTLSYRNYIREIVKGVNIDNIKDSYLNEMFLPLPPLPEQHRIVAKIEELFTKLDAGVEALKKAKEQIKRYRQAVLKYAFEGKLTEEWRKSFELLMLNNELKETQNPKLNIQHSTFNTQHSKFTTQNYEPASVLIERIKEERKKKLGNKYRELPPIDTSELPELPEEWMWTCLGNIAEFKNGINFNKDLKGNKGILTVDVLNMYSKGVFLNLDGLYRVNKVVNQEYLLRDGDVLFVRSSVKREGIGWASAFKEIGEPVIFCGFIIRARFPKYRILPKYAVYFLRTDFARKLIIGKGSQVTITNISQNSLATIPFPLATTTEQQKIVEEIERRFSVADEVEKAIDNSLKQAERLRQSILKRAFEGKLVPQDPNDEPAEKLLERIRDEKIKRESEKKVKKKGGK